MVSDFLSTEKNNDIYSVCLIRRRVNIFIDTPMSSVLTFVNRTTRSVSIRCPSPLSDYNPCVFINYRGSADTHVHNAGRSHCGGIYVTLKDDRADTEGRLNSTIIQRYANGENI